jgi:hypothetical protein
MKEIGPMEVKTIWANIFVLWGMAVSMIVLLMTDGLNKMSGWINQVRSRNQN